MSKAWALRNERYHCLVILHPMPRRSIRDRFHQTNRQDEIVL